jgi:acyl-CoA synthetase (NDP forming)
MTAEADLSALFDPRSVAIIGASPSPGKWGHEYSRQLLAGRHRRAVWLVNPRRPEILGQRSYAHVADLPEAPELALICVPRDAVEDAAAAALDRGARFLVVVTAGFGETGAEGAALQDWIVARTRAAGARLVGPNCLGLFDAGADFACMSFWTVPPGRVGIVSQSGTVLLEVAERLGRAGRGVSRAVSLGNQADIGIEEYVRLFAGHTPTQAMVIYAEQFRDGRAVLTAAATVRESGIPVVVLAPKASDAVARSVSSHTGSLVAPDRILDEALADIGALRVTGMGDLMRALDGLASPAPMRGRRLAVFADGGGCATLATAAAAAEGFDVPAFSPALTARLRAQAAPGCGLSNPVDVVGALDLSVFAPLVSEVARSGEVDGLLLSGFFNNVGDPDPDTERATGMGLLETATSHGMGLAVASLYPREPALRALGEAGVPLAEFPEDAARSLRLSVPPAPRRAVPRLPRAEPPVTPEDYFGARDLFASSGIPFAPAVRAITRADVIAAAERIGFPVVLKALASSHKSDGGGVKVGLRTPAELSDALDGMARLGAPSYSVEAMADLSGGVEVLIGALRDPSFGPTVTVGAGGTITEVLRDTVTALAPVDAPYAPAMLMRLGIARLFGAFRGRAPLDLEALAACIAAFSRVVASRPDIHEAELNPVFVRPNGVVAVDARVVCSATT